MAGLKVKIGADASQFERTMRGVRKDISGVKNSIMSIGAAVGAVWAVNKAFDGMKSAVRGVFDFLKESSREAAGIEALTSQFKTLLGSAGAAKDRIQEITEFAASTPFEIKELAAASKLLQTLTKGFLATGEGLRMVGDAAAVADQPIGDVATHIGRLFQGLTSGRSAGESMARLQELGLLTGEMRNKFENLAAAQKKGEAAALTHEEAMAMLKEAFKSTEGAMADFSKTMKAKLSNLQDNVDQLQSAFGAGFNEGLKAILDSTNEFLPTLKDAFTEAGEIAGTSIRQAMAGDPEMLLQIGKTIGTLVGDGLIMGVELAIEAGKDRIGDAIKNLSPLKGGIKAIGQAGKEMLGLGQSEGGGIFKNMQGQSADELRLKRNFEENIAQLRSMMPGGGSNVSQAQDLIRQMMAAAKPLQTDNPFEKQTEILRLIEKHLRGGALTN